MSMKTLFLAWQAGHATREWYPIGRLDADLAKSYFRFGYTHGAERAHKEVDLKPLDAFPDFNSFFESSELFPLFSNRVIGKERGEFFEYLKRLDLASEANPIEILAVTGGERQTDNFEVFPKVQRNEVGGFEVRFFLHGWRHVHEVARGKIDTLVPGERLQVSIETNNPATGYAVQLMSSDYIMLGWAPHYLVPDLVTVIAQCPVPFSARVIKVNPIPAPSKQRVLIQLEGCWPQNFEPMAGPDFQLIKADVPVVEELV
jgi:hypothetical protein